MTRPAIGAARRRRIIGENLLAYAFLLPALAVLLVFHFLPGFAAVVMSFLKWDIVPGGFRGLDNYQTVLVGGRAEEFWHSISVTLTDRACQNSSARAPNNTVA